VKVQQKTIIVPAAKQSSDVEKRKTVPFDKRIAALGEKIESHNLQEIKSDPFFKIFALNKYGKELDQLDSSTMATIWEELSQYLVEIKMAEANSQQVKLGTVNEELKAYYSKIDQARNDFNYPEVNRFLQAFLEKHKEISKQDIAKIYYLQGQNYELQIKYPEAERYYRKAVAMEEQNPLYLQAHAYILQNLRRYPEAEQSFRRVLGINEKQLGIASANVAITLHYLAKLRHIQLKYAEADSLFRRALTINEIIMGSERPNGTSSLNNLVGLLGGKDKTVEAELFFRKVIKIDEKQLGNAHPSLAINLYSLARLLQYQGKNAEAEQLYRRALAIDEKALGKDHPSTVIIRNHLSALPR